VVETIVVNFAGLVFGWCFKGRVRVISVDVSRETTNQKEAVFGKSEIGVSGGLFHGGGMDGMRC
jgi:hypothetical protein